MQNVLKSKMFIGALAAVAAVAAAVVIALNVGHSGNDLQTQLDLGNKYVSELDYENAIIAYEEALEIDPYCLEAYLGLYDAYLALGQQDKAIEIMEQAKNMLPDSVEVYVSLAQLYASQNQIGLVVSTLEEGIGGVTITLYPNQEMEPIEVSTNAIGDYSAGRCFSAYNYFIG